MRRTITLFSLALCSALGEATAGDFSGRVTVDGVPMAGITVAAEPHQTMIERALAEARGEPPPDELATTVTDEAGGFRLRLPSDSGRVALRFEGPAAVPKRTRESFDASLDHDIGAIALPRPRPLAGRVVDPDGEPAPGVEVILLAGGGNPFGNVSAVKRTILTDLHGRFRFDDAGAPWNRLTFRARGYAFQVRDGAKPGVVPQPITLRPGHSLSVVVTDASGPAADVLVRFEGDGRSPWFATGEAGRARLKDLPAGTGRIVAEAGDRGVGETSRFSIPRSDTATVEIELSPGRVVEGLVFDIETRRPIAGATVNLRGESQRLIETGADGRYHFAALLPSPYDVEATADGYATGAGRADVGQTSSARLDLALVRSAGISGRVVDETGRPVAEATGRIQPVRRRVLDIYRFRRALRNGGPDFTTGPDGIFSASGLTPGDDQALVVSHPEYGSTTVGGVALRAGQETRDVAVVLQRGPSLTGLVTDMEDEPIAGAELTLERSFQGRRSVVRRWVGPPGTESPKAVTDASGTFRFGGVTPGTYALAARAPGYATTRLDPVSLSEDEGPTLLKMAAGATIAGRVVRPDGSGARDTFVTAMDGRQVNARSFRDFGAQTADDGFFYIENLEAGASYVVQVMASVGEGPRVFGVVAPAEGVELEVAGIGRIEGRVDDETGAPLTEFDVDAEYDDRRGGRFMMRGVGRGQDSRVAAADGSFVLEELDVGRWTVVVSAEGYREARVGGIEVEENRTTGGVEVRLSQGSAILGTVVDDSGRPIIDATVSAAASGESRRRMRPFGAPTARSDADGAFELSGLTEGPYAVTASHVDFADTSESVDLGDGVTQVTLRMPSGGVLAGTVVAQDQNPLPGAQVVLSVAGDTRTMARFSDQGAVTDQAGRFKFDHLVEGRYTVQATYREGASPSVDVVLGASERREDVLIALDAGATINGLVSGLSELELSMVQIWASGEDRYSAGANVGGDGRFELVGVPTGQLTIRASVGNMASGDSRNTMVRAIVPEGALDVPVEVVFEPGFTLSGIVTRGGEPAAQTWVSANREGTGESSGYTTTDASGVYSIVGLPPGSYNVGAGSFRDTVEVSGDTTFDIELPTSSVAGRVVEGASQAPLAEVEVSVEGGEASRRRGSVATDVNGRFTIEGLVPGPYTLTAHRAGFGFESVSITVEDGSTEDVVVELTRAEGVGLRVRDGIFAIPLRGVNVSALDSASITAFSGSVPLDSDGKGEIAGLKAGIYTLVVGSTGYAPLTLPGIAAPAAVVDVALTPGGRLEIHVGPETLTTAPRASLSTTTGMAYRSAFGGDGSFRLNAPLRNRDHVAPGSYIFLIEGVPTETLQIHEGATTVLQLR